MKLTLALYAVICAAAFGGATMGGAIRDDMVAHHKYRPLVCRTLPGHLPECHRAPKREG